jgi:hypothetical protein
MRVKNDRLRAAHVKMVLMSQVGSASAYVFQNRGLDLNASECSRGCFAEGEKGDRFARGG